MVLAVVALTAVCGCYLPTKFKAEINISDNGDYTMNFSGTLAAPGIAPGLTFDHPDAATLAERVENVRRDLIRDPGFQDLRYLGGGIYQIDYRRAGNVRTEKTVTFVRTDSKILTIAFVKTSGEIQVRGVTIPSAQRKWILDAGLNMIGELRITTTSAVKNHNATTVIDGDKGAKTYVWVINGVDAKAPSFTLG